MKEKNLKIMLIDKEKEITKVIMEFLKSIGYNNVVSVNSDKEILSKFNKQKFDIVFHDLFLLNNGRDHFFLKRMKKINPDVKVVFITAQIGYDKENIIKEGYYAFLKKPFDLHEIIRILDNVHTCKK